MRPRAVSLVALSACAACTLAEPSSPSSSTAPTERSSVAAGEVPLDFSSLDARIETRLRETPDVRGAVVLVMEAARGVVHARAYGAFTLDRRFALGTSSTLLSAGVILRLVDQGKLGLDDEVRAVLQAWGDHKPGVTVAQLLSGSAGLPSLDEVRSAALGVDGEAPSVALAAHGCQRQSAGTLSACARAIYEDDAAETNHPPDTRFAFGGSQLQLAAALAEHVSGRSWDALIDATYREPCGAHSLGYRNFHEAESVDAPYAYPHGFDVPGTPFVPTENPSIDSGAFITSPDFAKLLLMHLRGGRCGDHQVLAPSTTALMREDRIGTVFGGVSGSPLASGYGLGWFVGRGGAVSAPGSHGAYPMIDVQRGYAVLLLLEEEYIMGAQFLLDLKPGLDALFPVR